MTVKREAMNVHVHELAKTLGLSSKELIEKLHRMKVEVKSHMSVVPPEAVQLLKKKEVKPTPPPKEVPKVPVKPTAPLVQKVSPAKEIAPPKPTQAFAPPAVKAPEVQLPEKPKVLQSLQVQFPITVKDLSVKVGIKPSELIKSLMHRKIFVTINQVLD